jgi:hypothetical protein
MIFGVFAKIDRDAELGGMIAFARQFQGKGAKMSEFGDSGSAGHGVEQSDERIDLGRREALMRLAKYTAPAMLVVLMSASRGAATPVSGPVKMEVPG